MKDHEKIYFVVYDIADNKRWRKMSASRFTDDGEVRVYPPLAGGGLIEALRAGSHVWATPFLLLKELTGQFP